MIDLKEMQFELLPFADADAGAPFGIGLGVSVDAEGFQPGAGEWLTEDSDNPRSGATHFGRDVLTGPTWIWAAHVNRTDHYEALATLGAIERAWRGSEIRSTVGAVTALRYRLGDRVRRVYGRPRRFEKTVDNRILTGFAPVNMDFKCVDSNTYDDVEDHLTLNLYGNESDGGIVLPAVLPLASLPSGSDNIEAVVGGDSDTYPVIRFEGPIVNPGLYTEAWNIALNLTLAEGEFVVVDTRPWAMNVLLNGDTSIPGALGLNTWLADIKFTPGDRFPLTFRGSGTLTGAQCDVRWRSAWASI